MATTLASLLAAAAVATGGLLAPGSGASGTALVIDAATAREGRELVDPRLLESGVEVRLPRTASEALTNVRYFAAQDRRVVVAGPLASEAAGTAGVRAERAAGIAGALAAIGG